MKRIKGSKKRKEALNGRLDLLLIVLELIREFYNWIQ